MNCSLKLILASQSPRRRALLAQLGVDFTALTLPSEGNGSVREVRRSDETPADYVCRMARAKALVGLRQARLLKMPSLPVLGSDTEVVLDDDVFGKAENRDEAAAMLRRLSGRTHAVMTAVTLAKIADKTPTTATRIVVSHVSFRALSDSLIDDYLDSGEWQGKAGAYAIQGRAAAFVTWLSGSYTAVVGLPLCEVADLLA
jgi:septum formation protein